MPPIVVYGIISSSHTGGRDVPEPVLFTQLLIRPSKTSARLFGIMLTRRNGYVNGAETLSCQKKKNNNKYSMVI